MAIAAAAVLVQGGGRLHARPRHPGHPQEAGFDPQVQSMYIPGRGSCPTTTGEAVAV
ncbi:MAG: hypothetical protein M5R42_11835 [Rhodocyclaceae bacterium]|nr:hypothetical protein [Rhodocyclaceae bacterium]